MNEKVIAIDPGREKCGIAIVTRGEGALWKKVINTAELAAIVTELAHSHGTTHVIIGDRTSHRAAWQVLATIAVNDRLLTIEAVDEHRSSEEARGRYWQENPPRGVMKLIPVTMRIPPVPVDDYVAVILAERFFLQK